MFFQGAQESAGKHQQGFWEREGWMQAEAVALWTLKQQTPNGGVL